MPSPTMLGGDKEGARTGLSPRIRSSKGRSSSGWTIQMKLRRFTMYSSFQQQASDRDDEKRNRGVLIAEGVHYSRSEQQHATRKQVDARAHDASLGFPRPSSEKPLRPINSSGLIL